MSYVLGILLIALIIFAAANRNYQKALFKDLDIRKDPLKLLYSASARVCHLIKGILPSDNANNNIHLSLKRLCVRENAEQELYLYRVKKTAAIYCMLILLCTLGILLDITSAGSSVSTLKRAGYGDGTTTYTLNADYGGESETVEITVDEEMYTDDEIEELFENSLEGIKQEVLAENSSFEYVTQPLDLITGYNGISISWESEDTSLIDYSGNISEDLEEGESILVNLYMTLYMEDVRVTYTLAVCIAKASMSSADALAEQIEADIAAQNSIYDSEVSLPVSINGTEITFSTIEGNSVQELMILGVIAVLALIFSYDKLLDEKLKKRDAQLETDLTEIVFKLSLLYEAGLSIYGAFERIVNEHEASRPKETHYAYQEMKLALERIKNGMSEAESYSRFGKRCGLHSYIRLGNILEQNLNKGTKGMKILLHQEAQAAFSERTRLARKKGEQAGTKLLFPMMLMLAVVIVIVAFPAFSAMSF